jgi:DeoR/GlpR family transcriptional regulator of sugar metabolism
MSTRAAETLLARAMSGRRAKRSVVILDLIAEHGSMKLTERPDTLSISLATARRDRTARPHGAISRRDLTVVTNSLTLAGLLSTCSGVRVVMTGGFPRPRSLELVGATEARADHAMVAKARRTVVVTGH